jgi:hypothetical protein
MECGDGNASPTQAMNRIIPKARGGILGLGPQLPEPWHDWIFWGKSWGKKIASDLRARREPRDRVRHQDDPGPGLRYLVQAPRCAISTTTSPMRKKRCAACSMSAILALPCSPRWQRISCVHAWRDDKDLCQESARALGLGGAGSRFAAAAVRFRLLSAPKHCILLKFPQARAKLFGRASLRSLFA